RASNCATLAGSVHETDRAVIFSSFLNAEALFDFCCQTVEDRSHCRSAAAQQTERHARAARLQKRAVARDCRVENTVTIERPQFLQRSQHHWILEGAHVAHDSQ